MNWFKAKNLILVSLLALNILLMMLIYVTSDTYVLSSEQIENMYQVLSSKYNIGIYAQLPKKYQPMKEMEVLSEGDSVTEYLYSIFFGESEGVTKFQEEDKVIFQGDGKTLMTQSGDFVISADTDLGMTREEILKELEKSFGNYVLYQKTTDGNKVIYDYRQKYKNQTVYTNYLLFEEVDGKVIKMEGYYAEVLGFIGDDREIISVDLALFNFANYYPKGEDEQLFIDSIDLVYNQEQVVGESDVILKATPCYLIQVRGSAAPVKIDAYTNTILTK